MSNPFRISKSNMSIHIFYTTEEYFITFPVEVRDIAEASIFFSSAIRISLIVLSLNDASNFGIAMHLLTMPINTGIITLFLLAITYISDNHG